MDRIMRRCQHLNLITVTLLPLQRQLKRGKCVVPSLRRRVSFSRPRQFRRRSPRDHRSAAELRLPLSMSCLRHGIQHPCQLRRQGNNNYSNHTSSIHSPGKPLNA
eukprot:2756106-Amphidinium_carterae.1